MPRWASVPLPPLPGTRRKGGSGPVSSSNPSAAPLLCPHIHASRRVERVGRPGKALAGGQRCELRRRRLCSWGLDFQVRCAPAQPRQAASASASPANAARGSNRPLRPRTEPPPLPPRPAHHPPPHSVRRSRVSQVLWSIACIRCLALPPLILAVSPCPTWTSWTLNSGRGLVQLLPKQVMGSPLSSSARSKITLDPVTGKCYPRRIRHLINRVVLS